MQSVDEKEIIRILNDIELNFDVNSLKYKELYAWPVIRLELYNHLKKSPRKNTGNRTPLSRLRKHYADLFWLLRKRFRHRGKRSRPFSARFILYGLSSHRSELINEKFFNRCTESIGYLLHGYGKCFYMESFAYDGDVEKPGRADVFNADEFLEKELFRNLLFSFPSLRQKTINRYPEFIDFLSSKLIVFDFPEEACAEKTELIYRYSEAFEKLFSEIRPEHLFTDIYYSEKNMAAIFAAGKLKIKSIEIQHGVHGNTHFAYVKWLNVPPEGYQLLPDYFWVWDRNSLRNLEKWNASLSKHKPILGGNPYLCFIRNNRSLCSFPQSLKESINKSSKMILITLNNMPGYDKLIFSNVVINTIRKSGSEILWIIRLHPHFPEVEDWLKTEFGYPFPENILVHQSSRVNLYLLLEKANLHVTLDSTVAMEALSFNVPSVVLTKNGYECFYDFISRDYIEYITSPDALLKKIAQPAGKILDDDEKIIADCTYMKSQIEKLCGLNKPL